MHRNHNRNVDFLSNYSRRLPMSHPNQSESRTDDSTNQSQEYSGRINLTQRASIPCDPSRGWPNPGIHPNPSLINFRNNLPVEKKKTEIISSINNCPGMTHLSHDSSK